MSYEIRVTDSTDQPHSIATQDTVKEAITGETLRFEAVGSNYITQLAPYDAQADCQISGETFVASSPGVYRLKCTAARGIRQILIRVVDPSVLAAIPDYGFRTGYGQAASPRLALRSICNSAPAGWDGTADWFWDGRIKLGDHGVQAPQNP